MSTMQPLFQQMYAAFNRRDIDGALSFMSEDVDWPKASEGGRVVGKQAIRDYWTRQWVEFDPRVDPLEVVDTESGRTDVTVHQVVMNKAGDILSDQQVVHTYTMSGGLINRMDISEGGSLYSKQHASGAHTEAMG